MTAGTLTVKVFFVFCSFLFRFAINDSSWDWRGSWETVQAGEIYISDIRLLLLNSLMGNWKHRYEWITEIIRDNQPFPEYRWHMHHKDFVKYAFCHCNMRDICRQAELYNICHLFLHIIFDFLLKIPLDNHLQACIITNAA